MSMPIPPIGPLTGLRTSKSFSWTFAIDVDTALGTVAQFDTFDEKLTQADTFIRGALGLMSHQSARCVFDILLDYSRLSDACDTVNHQADKLKEALSTYGAVMNNVRNKYKDLIAFAQTAGLSVVGDYTNCTVTLDASGSSQQDFMYGLAHSALNDAKSLQKMAEQEFATALNDVDTTLWEKTLTSLIDQLKNTYIPNSEHPVASTTSALGGWSDLASNAWRAGHAWFHNGHYAPPEDFAQLSKWKHHCERRPVQLDAIRDAPRGRSSEDTRRRRRTRKGRQGSRCRRRRRRRRHQRLQLLPVRHHQPSGHG